MWSCGSLPIVSAQTDNLDRPIPERRTLTLCFFGRSRRSRNREAALASPLSQRDRVCVCACTHYLVFKEPTARAPVAPDRLRFGLSGCLRSHQFRSCLNGPGRHRKRPRLGEPSEVTSTTRRCQGLFSCPRSAQHLSWTASTSWALLLTLAAGVCWNDPLETAADSLVEEPLADFPADRTFREYRVPPAVRQAPQLVRRVDFQHVLALLALGQHDERPLPHIGRRQLPLLVRHRHVVHIDAAAPNEARRFAARTREARIGKPLGQRMAGFEILPRDARRRRVLQRRHQLLDRHVPDAARARKELLRRADRVLGFLRAVHEPRQLAREDPLRLALL